jgi:hypothetical protein
MIMFLVGMFGGAVLAWTVTAFWCVVGPESFMRFALPKQKVIYDGARGGIDYGRGVIYRQGRPAEVVGKGS